MKKILIFILITGLTAVAYADDLVETTLDTPEVITPSGTKKIIQSMHFYRHKVVAKYNTKSAADGIVKQEDCVIVDWSEVTVPASCSDGQYASQSSCEANEGTWTPATIVQHNNFTAIWDATIAAGKVGQRYMKVMAQGLSNRCKDSNHLDFSGTDE